jgi:hypothetical protein
MPMKQQQESKAKARMAAARGAVAVRRRVPPRMEVALPAVTIGPLDQMRVAQGPISCEGEEEWEEGKRKGEEEGWRIERRFLGLCKCCAVNF